MNNKPGTTKARSQPALHSLGEEGKSEVRLLRPSDQDCRLPSGCRLASGVRRLPSGCLSSSFTLVELLVVIVVISILVGITLSVSKYAMRRANEARQEVMRAKIRSALEEYRATYGEYPITPDTNPPGNYADAIRHYPATFPTECATTSNSPFTNVFLATAGTMETLTIKNNPVNIDYALTYPLMLRQLQEGKRPFMEFPEVTVGYLVWRTLKETSGTIYRWSRSGWRSKTLYYISGDAINRPKAIIPGTTLQWKYTSTNGLSYTLTNQP